MGYLEQHWKDTTPVYESESLDTRCAYEGGTCVVSLSLSGGDGIVEGFQLPVSEATDGSCLPNNSMVVEWATTNLTARQHMSGKEITCTASNPSGYPTYLAMTTTLNVQCKSISLFIYIYSCNEINKMCACQQCGHNIIL